MSKSVEAIVTPEILKWARDTSGYNIDTIANKMKKSSEIIKKWENGELKPTISQLRKLANYYKRPLAIFYLSELPETIKPLADFRRIEIEEIYKEPVKLQYEIRRAIFRREAALELLTDLNEKPIEFMERISVKDDPSKVSKKIREFLIISADKQFGWKDKYEALNNWITSVENLGIFVFQATGIDIDEMRGFSICEFPLPIIGLNIKDHPHARIFSLIHELVHIMLDVSGICDIYEGLNFRRHEEYDRHEIYCNKVAGLTLVPDNDLLMDDIVINKGSNKEWSDYEIGSLSKKYRVSREVILRRLLDVDKTSKRFYNSKRKDFLKFYDDFKSKQETKRLVPPYRKVLSYNGVSFTNLVIDGYYRGVITSMDLSNYLNTNVKHLPKIETELVSKAQKYGASL